MDPKERARRAAVARKFYREKGDKFLGGFRAHGIVSAPNYADRVAMGLKVPAVPNFNFTPDKMALIRHGIAAGYAGNKSEMHAIRKYNKDKNMLLRDALTIGRRAPGGLGKG
jgi:hypothetical protein